MRAVYRVEDSKLGGAPRQITQRNITAPRWSPAGGEIFISRHDELWSLPVATDPALRIGAPVKLFELPGKRPADSNRPEFDVTADGRGS